MTHRGTRSAAPAAAPVCRAAGTLGFPGCAGTLPSASAAAARPDLSVAVAPAADGRPGPVMNRAGGRSALMHAIWG
jgi:hypothetical protein